MFKKFALIAKKWNDFAQTIFFVIDLVSLNRQFSSNMFMHVKVHFGKYGNCGIVDVSSYLCSIISWSTTNNMMPFIGIRYKKLIELNHRGFFAGVMIWIFEKPIQNLGIGVRILINIRKKSQLLDMTSLF